MKVSVIVPIYNGEKFLEKLIRNITLITYKKVEYIFVDNNSTDNSVLKLKSLLELTEIDNYFILSEDKQGAGNARNKGIEYATGEILAFLDCDDFIDPSKYEVDVEFFKNNVNVDFVFCRALRVYDDGRVFKNPIDGILKGVNLPPKLGLIWLNNYFHLQGPGSILVRKEVVTSLGCFPESLIGEDAFLLIRMGLKYVGFFYDETYFEYYRHSNSTVSLNNEQNGTLLSYFELKKMLFSDKIVKNNKAALKTLKTQLISDILKLNKIGYKINNLKTDSRLDDLSFNCFIFNSFSLKINKLVSKNYYNPFYWIWFKINKHFF